MILIADSGSTKTDWVLASDDGLVIKSMQTEGITPVHQTVEYIKNNNWCSTSVKLFWKILIIEVS